MPLSKARHAAFLTLLDQATRNEVACGDFLTEAAPYLVRITGATIIDVLREHRAHYGDSDFTIIFEARNSIGRQERYAIVWEIKAPQCIIMERDGNNNRCRPTIDFVKAENQLVHYHQELKLNGEFCRVHQITSPDNIKLGGIIIGRDASIVDQSKLPNMLRTAQTSFEIRLIQLYDHAKISVMTWDRIAEFLAP